VLGYYPLRPCHEAGVHSAHPQTACAPPRAVSWLWAWHHTKCWNDHRQWANNVITSILKLPSFYWVAHTNWNTHVLHTSSGQFRKRLASITAMKSGRVEWCIQLFNINTWHHSGELSLLPSAGREMSTSLRATGWRPSVADWGGGMSANCGSSCSLRQAMEGHVVRYGIISSCQLISCHFRDCKAFLVTYSWWHCNVSIATFTFYLKHDRPSLQWWIVSISETVRLLDLCKASMFHFLMRHPVCALKHSLSMSTCKNGRINNAFSKHMVHLVLIRFFLLIL